MKAVGRRPHGTGSLFIRTSRSGAEAWYAQWRVGGRLVKRRVGPTRASSPKDGLTRAQAERECRRLDRDEPEQFSVSVRSVRGTLDKQRRWPNLVVDRVGELEAIEIEFRAEERPARSLAPR
jgi:hypothetical protein